MTQNKRTEKVGQPSEPKGKEQKHDQQQNKEAQIKRRRKRNRRNRHTEMSKVMRDGLKKQVAKPVNSERNSNEKGLPDEAVEEQKTIVDEEKEVVEQKVEESFEEKKEEVIEAGKKHEETIKREKTAPVIETEENRLKNDRVEEMPKKKKGIEKKESREQHEDRKQKSATKNDDSDPKDEEGFEDIFGDDFLVEDQGTESDVGDELFTDFLTEPENLEKNEANKEKSEDQAVQPKKKSYLEILKEEAQKFEEMEAKRQENPQPVEPATELVSKPEEEIDIFSDDAQFEEPDWLKPKVQHDGIHADATERVQKMEIKDEVKNQGKVVKDSDDLFGDMVFEPKENELNPGQADASAQVISPHKTVGFHEGTRDELYKGEKAFSEGGIHQGAEIFSGGEAVVEQASEDVVNVESGGGATSGPAESVNEEDRLSIRDAMNEKRSEINDVLESGGKKKNSGNFLGELKGVLDQAGFSWKKIKGFCSLILIILVLFLGYWFDLHRTSWEFITGLEIFGGGNEISEPVPVDPNSNFWSIEAGYRFSLEPYGELSLPFMIESGLYFGEPIDLDGVPRHSGVDVGLIFGETAEVRESQRFAYYVEYVGQLRNIYLTDLEQLLNNAVDREKELDRYKNQLAEMYQRGLGLSEEVNIKLAEIKAEFETVTAAKDVAEKEFFANLEAFDGSQSDDALKVFTDLRRQQVDLRAEFNALTRVAEEFEKVLVRIKLRLEAIDLNRGALIEGIKVTPIPGSNLDLVEGAAN